MWIKRSTERVKVSVSDQRADEHLSAKLQALTFMQDYLTSSSSTPQSLFQKYTAHKATASWIFFMHLTLQMLQSLQPTAGSNIDDLQVKKTKLSSPINSNPAINAALYFHHGKSHLSIHTSSRLNEESVSLPLAWTDRCSCSLRQPSPMLARRRQRGQCYNCAMLVTSLALLEGEYAT